MKHTALYLGACILVAILSALIGCTRTPPVEHERECARYFVIDGHRKCMEATHDE